MTERVVIGTAGMLGALMQQLAADVAPETPVVLEMHPSAVTEPPSMDNFIERNRQRVRAKAERERTKSGTRECARRRRQMERQRHGQS